MTAPVMVTGKIDDILAHGNPQRLTRDGYTSWIDCADGFRLSVIAGQGAYSTPRTSMSGLDHITSDYGPSSYPGPYTHVEVGFPSARPEPWDVNDAGQGWDYYAETSDDPTVHRAAMLEVAAPVSAERLYGIPDSETLHDDIGAAYESQIEPWLDQYDDRRPRVIEEWSVCPPRLHLRSPSELVEWLLEDASENCGADDYFEHAEHLARGPEVLAAADALITAMADRITYRVADKRLAEHTITWDGEDEPLLDGERLYVRQHGCCPRRCRMTASWDYDAGIVDSDRDEARSARLHAEMADDPHHPVCRCRPCLVERSGLSDAEIRGAG